MRERGRGPFRPAPAVLIVLRNKPVGKIVPQALSRRRAREEDREVNRDEEVGGPGPPSEYTFSFVFLLFCLSFMSLVRGRCISFVLVSVFWRERGPTLADKSLWSRKPA